MQSIRFLAPRLSFVRHPEDARFELGTHLLNSDSIRSRNAEARKEGFGLSWSWEQERFEFLAEKALWRPEGRELLIADLHLGKAEVFQAHGIPLPSDGDRGTLNPLLDLCARVQPKTLIILGDLVHGPLGLTASLRETLAALPELTGCPITLVGGTMIVLAARWVWFSNRVIASANFGSAMNRTFTRPIRPKCSFA